MSRKIYDAWRSTRPVKTVEELLAIGRELQLALEPLSKQVFHTNAAHFLARHIDAQCSILETVKTCAYHALQQACDDARAELAKGFRNSTWDVNAEWTFWPADDGHILLQIFTELPYKKVLPAVWKEYHYQNAGDRPKSICEKEWEKRADDWQKAKGDKAPSQTGLSMELWGQYNGPHAMDLDAILEHIPAFETRLKAAATSLLRNAVCGPLVQNLKKEKPDCHLPTEVAQILRTFNDWLFSKEGQNAFQNKSVEIQALLPKEITKDTVLENY